MAKTPDTAAEQMRQIGKKFKETPHWAHVKADELLCNVLEGIGFEKMVREFKKIHKWYS